MFKNWALLRIIESKFIDLEEQLNDTVKHTDINSIWALDYSDKNINDFGKHTDYSNKHIHKWKSFNNKKKQSF